MEVHYLWAQERIAYKDFVLKKVCGKHNPADLLTKYLNAETIKRYANVFGLVFLTGRADAAPTVHSRATDCIESKIKRCAH